MSTSSSVDGLTGHNTKGTEEESTATSAERASSMSPPPPTSSTAVTHLYHSSNGVPTRKEHAPKVMCDIFARIVRVAHKECKTKMHSCTLTLDEIISKRPKILGLSFMSGIVNEIASNLRHQSSTDALSSGTRENLSALLGEWNATFSRDWDHMDVRFGQEVIFGASELDAFSSFVIRGRTGRLVGRVKSSSRKLQQLSSRSLRQLSHRVKRSRCATAAAAAMGVGCVTACVCHAYGLLLLSRRVLGLSPPWKMAITHVVGLAAAAWSVMLTLWVSSHIFCTGKKANSILEGKRKM